MDALKRRRTVPIRLACFCALLIGAVMLTHAQENQPQYADQLYSQAKWRQAAAAYETFASENPDYTYLTRIYMRIGQAYGELEELEKARKAYAKGVEAGPDDAYIYSIISLWGNMYIRRYQYAEAQTMCENLMRAYPNTTAAEYAHYSLGTYLELGKAETAKAAAAYESFIKLYPNSMYFSGAVNRLTSLLIQSGEAEKAEALLMERIGMSPNNASLLDQLAAVYQQQGRLDDAVRLLEKALERRPGDSDLLESLGEAYAAKGDRKKARAVWLRTVDAENEQYSQRLQLGYLFQRHGFFEDAVEQYERASAMQPSFSYLYTRIANVYQILGKADKAFEVYMRSLRQLGFSYSARRPILEAVKELLPAKRIRQEYERLSGEADRSQDLTALLTAAEFAFLAEQYEASLERLKALSGRIDSAETMEQFGGTLMEKERPRDALRFLKGAIDLNPTAPGVARRYAAVGRAQEALELYEESAESYRSAIRFDPLRQSDPNLDSRLAQVYMGGMRRPDLALTHLQEASSLQQLEPQLEDLTLLTAEAYLLLGDLASAGVALVQNRSHFPEKESKRQFLTAELLFFNGQHEEAEKLYEKVAETYLESESSNDALARVALIHNGAGNAEALILYAEALRLRANGKLAEAMSVCEEVAESAKRIPLAQDALSLLAETAVEAGESERAVAAYETLAEEQGHLGAQALTALGRLYDESGNRTGAIDAYERLLKRNAAGAFAVSARARLRALMDEESTP